jgi:hypothetical protein
MQLKFIRLLSLVLESSQSNPNEYVTKDDKELKLDAYREKCGNITMAKESELDYSKRQEFEKSNY